MKLQFPLKTVKFAKVIYFNPGATSDSVPRDSLKLMANNIIRV